MKILKQLFRQPLKTLVGVAFMTLAVTIACVCVGQSIAAQTTRKSLDERFTTLAIPSLREDMKGVDRYIVEEELLQWLEKTAAEHPEILRGLSEAGLLSAYIPELMPYNPGTGSKTNTQMIDRFGDLTFGDDMVYFSTDDLLGQTYFKGAMLVITVDEVGQILSPMDRNLPEPEIPGNGSTEEEWQAYQEALERYQQDLRLLQREREMGVVYTEGYRVTLTGKVDQVITMADGMKDFTGMNIRVTVVLPTREELEALNLEAGAQYVVYGQDFLDMHQYLVDYMKKGGYKHIKFDPFDPSLLKVPSAHDIETFWRNKRIKLVMYYNYVPLEQWQYEILNTVSLTVCNPSNRIPYEVVRDENGRVVDRIPQKEVTYLDADGKEVTIPMEEYDDRYATPSIAKLTGSLEQFLASQEGQVWKAAKEQNEVNNHAFAVLGVEELHQLATFSLGDSKVVEGREFTAAEAASGAKVCLIHEWVANEAGLKIGDTITLSFYGTDYALPGKAFGSEYEGLLRPAASEYFSTTPVLETAEYTIVGFWQGDVWPDASEYYAFSANTVFVPRASVQAEMKTSDSILMTGAVLENGMIYQFHDLVKRSGYAGRFKYMDQDYSQIVSNFHNFEALAQQIMLIGLALYAILLLLFLLLYPATQMKTVKTMASMGCGFGRRFIHVLLSAMTVIVISAALGGALGSMLWDRVVALMQSTAGTTVDLQLPADAFKQILLAQVAGALVLNVIVAIFVAAPRGLAARR